MSKNKETSTDNHGTASSSTRTEELKNLRLTYLELLNEAEATQNGGVLEQLFDVELISLFSKLLLERSCRVASDFMNLSNFAQKQIEYNTSICPGNETVRKQWQQLGRHRFSQLFIPLNHTIRSSENKNQEVSAKSQSRKRVVQSVCPDESSTTIDSVHVLKQVQSKDDSDASILCDFVYREFRKACKMRNVDRLDVSEFVCDPNSFDKTVRNMFYLSFLINEVIKAFNIKTALIGPFPDI
ncbi:hypothetical protein T4E_4012 [Trichinella pseudospiralis]|uniref:Non-structural maintenance of chromosome element 4 C-terminal domain-containing protein n=1 Tax=Trichinella pseudospiralis TaxID=6337 RepID=A0A0V0XRS1_TRIPS|nr:hypothetical protein T4E_4012 [Trichinella pseudospiralis]